MTKPLTPAQQTEVERLIPYAARIARSFTRLFADDEFESEAMLALCEAVAAHSPSRGPLDQFVGVCIRNRLIRVGEKRKRRGPTVEEEYLPPAPPAPLDVYTEIDQLPEGELRDIAHMRLVERRKWSEVTAALGLGIKAARARLNRAKAILRRRLDNTYGALNDETDGT